uniref:Uncharacterized protein n=1 Tax=Tetranychus urticae TaxID=32264 RepID=T1KRL1_TETUR
MMKNYSSGGMTPPRDDDEESSDDEGPGPAIIDSGPEDSEADDDEDDDGQTAQINHCLGPDGYFHPVKEIKGSYLKKDKTGKMRLVKRVRWMDTDVWADTVDCPHLPFRGYVNHKRKDVVDLTVKPKKNNPRKKNPEKACQWCGQVFSRASYCTDHEIRRCRAPGSLNHTCGPSCRQNPAIQCPGRITMDEYDPGDRRHNNPGRPSNQ